MFGIDPSIVENDIKTYPDANLVRHNLRPANLRKVASIKAENEKLLHTNFIYHIRLTEWVSNLVPVDKKQVNTQVCTDFCDLNLSFPNGNFTTNFIDKIISECVGNEIFSFMDSFSGYNQIHIRLEDQQKTAFICFGGTLDYKKTLGEFRGKKWTSKQKLYH